MYSTYYLHGKRTPRLRIYTTKSLTPHHEWLRECCDGRTFEHSPEAVLYFSPGVPLDRPMGSGVREIR